jgi:hypothetical protein
MKKLYLYWVPHAMDTNQKVERATLSHGILLVLPGARSTGFQSIITGDKSWFFLYYLRDSIGASSRDELPERVSQTIDTEKYPVSLLWSVNGGHSLVDVLKGSAYNAPFFCDNLLKFRGHFLVCLPAKTMRSDNGVLLQLDSHSLQMNPGFANQQTRFFSACKI